MTLRLAAALAVFASTAQAQQCGPRDVVLAHLATKYGETRQMIGIAANGQVMEMIANPATGTWTIAVTHPAGAMCLVASGRSYEVVTEVLPPEGVPG